jgi:hypothetical protein
LRPITHRTMLCRFWRAEPRSEARLATALPVPPKDKGRLPRSREARTPATTIEADRSLFLRVREATPSPRSGPCRIGDTPSADTTHKPWSRTMSFGTCRVISSAESGGTPGATIARSVTGVTSRVRGPSVVARTTSKGYGIGCQGQLGTSALAADCGPLLPVAGLT